MHKENAQNIRDDEIKISYRKQLLFFILFSSFHFSDYLRERRNVFGGGE